MSTTKTIKIFRVKKLNDIPSYDEVQYLNNTGITEYYKVTDLISLNIFKRRTGEILNYILNWYIDQKGGIIRYGNGNGGFLISSKSEFQINTFGEVKVKLEEKRKYGKEYCRKKIYEKLKGRLVTVIKQFILMNPSVSKFELTYDKWKTDSNLEPIFVDLKELKFLMKFFKDDKNLKISKAEKNLFNDLIGERQDNQFVISAINVIQNSMKELKEDAIAQEKKLNEEFQEKIIEVRTIYNENLKKMKEEVLVKQKKLDEELEKLKSMIEI